MSNNLFDWNRFLTLLKINLKLNRGVYTAVAIITMVLAFSFVLTGALGLSWAVAVLPGMPPVFFASTLSEGLLWRTAP